MAGPACAQTPPPGPAPTERPQALSEEIPRGATVANRPRPDYDPGGLRAGGFLFFPDLVVQEQYESNIFATPNNERADLITTVIPSLRVKSDWNNHALSFFGDTVVNKYYDNGDEDYMDHTVGIDGRLDIRRDARVFGGVAYRVRHEERSSPDNVQAADSPIEYNVASAIVGGEKEFNRLQFRLENVFERYSFVDAENQLGQPIDLSNRDRNQYNVTLRTAYELQPLRQVYLLTGYNRRDYNRDINSGGVDRDSQGFTVGPGIRYDIDGVIFLDLFAGYRRQDFADPTLRTVNGVVGEGRLTWNVTKLTTVTALVSRDLRESTLVGASSYFATRAALTVDHELWRNLLLNGRVEYERDSYQGSIDRTDNYYVAGVGAKYLINRYLAASGGYGYRERSSDANNADFVDHTVTLRLGVHY